MWARQSGANHNHYIEKKRDKQAICGTYRSGNSPWYSSNTYNPDCPKCMEILRQRAREQELYAKVQKKTGSKVAPGISLSLTRFAGNRQFNPMDPASWTSLPEDWDKAELHRRIITTIDKAFLGATKFRQKAEEEEKKRAEERKRKKKIEANKAVFVKEARAVQAQLREELEFRITEFMADAEEVQVQILQGS